MKTESLCTVLIEVFASKSQDTTILYCCLTVCIAHIAWKEFRTGRPIRLPSDRPLWAIMHIEQAGNLSFEPNTSDSGPCSQQPNVMSLNQALIEATRWRINSGYKCLNIVSFNGDSIKPPIYSTQNIDYSNINRQWANRWFCSSWSYSEGIVSGLP